MRQIRYGTFETNSSSTHSIVVSKNKFNKDDVNSWVNFWCGELNDPKSFEFGRCQLDLFDHWDEKLAYIFIALCENGYKRKVIKNFEKRVIRLFYEVLGDNQLLFEDKTPENVIKVIRRVMKNSYIDHSCNVPKEFLDKCLTDDEFLVSFLFDIKDSYIACGGDEYSGYYIKQVGFEYDYSFEDNGFWNKLEEYKKNHYVYLKGN